MQSEQGLPRSATDYWSDPQDNSLPAQGWLAGISGFTARATHVLSFRHGQSDPGETTEDCEAHTSDSWGASSVPRSWLSPQHTEGSQCLMLGSGRAVLGNTKEATVVGLGKRSARAFGFHHRRPGLGRLGKSSRTKSGDKSRMLDPDKSKCRHRPNLGRWESAIEMGQGTAYQRAEIILPPSRGRVGQNRSEFLGGRAG